MVLGGVGSIRESMELCHNVLELVNTIRVVGIRKMVAMARAYKLGWMEILTGFYTTRTLQALFNIGFFDELNAKGRLRLEDFAREKGLDLHILTSLCNSLYALKILDRDGDEYLLDAKGRILSQSARGWFVGTYGYESVFHNLEALLRKEKEYGKEVQRLSRAHRAGQRRDGGIALLSSRHRHHSQKQVQESAGPRLRGRYFSPGVVHGSSRILEPQSKLATSQWWHTTTLPEILGVSDAREDDLYAAMDWVLKRQEVIEKKNSRRAISTTTAWRSMT